MLTFNFDDPLSADLKLVGGKAHGLAMMTQAGIPVSPGFTVSTTAYRDYLATIGLRQRLESVLGAVDRVSIDALDDVARTVHGWFVDMPLPAGSHAAVAVAYERLCASLGFPEVSVAVRSSATAEDSAGASFAGEYETFVGMRGLAQVELHIRLCWASAFTARALSYAWKNGIDPLDVDMAVVVQKTVNARAAGVMFTVSPLTGDRSRIHIEASYGLGLGVVGGEVTPDRYVVAKIEGHVVDRVLGDKHLEYIGGQVATPVDVERRGKLCLDDEEVMALARLGKRLERLNGAPQDIEFAVDRELPPGQNIVLLQCRPVTVLPGRGEANPVSADALSRMAASVLAAAKPH
ncbi:similar to subunit B of phenylphosphate synthetase or phosphoenolpyruvate synthase [Aromatoleum aromaticum EbN1]|uniref:Phosphoenolpyruvate synthase n=1 Tax=Aromatoleum aromaticum (strain DSM 19018 / LMG 30748 / EbN1) TaxID=76114 RepID=Q5NZV6_AROAE|nr:PEP/pyruvate-binding domain-containing protein [Aromatoleum aromaticum]CAI09408.1 similar to subunit B of phenylphosphate synthetase or phosphoenolpyruvate synthase [Aromatoleum aromaticum EbN1]